MLEGGGCQISIQLLQQPLKMSASLGYCYDLRNEARFLFVNLNNYYSKLLPEHDNTMVVLRIIQLLLYVLPVQHNCTGKRSPEIALALDQFDSKWVGAGNFPTST